MTRDHSKTCWRLIGLALLFIFMLTALLKPGVAVSLPMPENEALIKREMAYHTGVLAYIYGYPMVDMLKQMHNDTHRVSDTQATYAPVNHFYYFRQLATPETTGSLRAPDDNTLYFAGWFDLSKGPVVIHNPDTKGRYFTMAVTNLYAEVMHLGRRTIGTKEQYHALIGPGWKGVLPGKVTPIYVDTDQVRVLGRLLVDGEQDLPVALKLLDDFWANPLSQWRRGKPPAPPAPPGLVAAIDPMDSVEYFGYLNTALRANSPREGEEALMGHFDQIGVGPFSNFNSSKLDPEVRAGLERAIADAQALIQAASQGPLPAVNGWTTSIKTPCQDYNYLQRAADIKGGYSNLPEESIYSTSLFDNQQAMLHGDKRYQLSFSRASLPPVNGFWSVSAYRLEDAKLEHNTIERYSIGDHSEDLHYDENGTLTLHLQHAAPAQNSSNWLPTPAGDYYIIMRMYEPKKPLLDGSYQLPPVVLVE